MTPLLTDVEKKEIAAQMQQYDQKRSACIEALQIVQRHRRWISDETLHAVAEFLDMTPHELDNVATFYNLIYRRPVGEHVIHVCDSISCWIMGYEQLLAELSARLGVELGETTGDGQFTLLPIPCLGTCDHAPAMMIDEDLHRDLDAQKLGNILTSYGIKP